MKLRSVADIAGFFRSHRLKVLRVVTLQVMAGFAENLGILAMLPIIQGLMTNGNATSSVGAYLARTVSLLGLPADTKGYLVLVSVAVIAKAGISYASIRAGHALIIDVMIETRLALIRGLMGLRWPEFARHKSGEVVALQITEMERFRPSLSQFLALMTVSIHIVIYLISSILVSWQLTVVALSLGLMKVAVLRPIRKRMYRYGAAYSEGIDKLTVGLVEGLNNIKSTRAMGADRSLIERLKRGVHDYRVAAESGMRQSAWFSVADDLLTSIILIVVLIVCSAILSVDLAQMAIIAVLMTRILSQIGNLQKAQHTIDSTGFIANRILSALENYGLNREHGFGNQAVSLHKDLRLSRVTVGYDEATVLRGVDLVIPAGSLCALTGRSGGGKTTLIDCLLGLVIPTSGEVLIDGVNLQKSDISAWRAKVGYVPQDIMLFHDSIFANIVMGRPGIDEADVRAALVAAEALEFTEALPRGIHTLVGERGTALSGGQRQRIALARALVHKPDLLILDEATSALDPATEAEICETLRHLAGDRTIIAVSHQPRIAEIADLIVSVGDAGVKVQTKSIELLGFAAK